MEFAGRYDPSLSRDYVNNDLEPNKTDEHGTNCAGVIAGAANNGICGVGIAYNAKIAGIQLTSSGIPEDSVLARAMFPFDGHGIDVFSCSWGPPDVGFKVQGPGPLTRRAFLNGVIKGRNGRGSLYVFSAGNGVLFGDNCAFNGFVNNIHTIGVAALDKNGKPMLSSEPCSAVMTAAFADNLETASASNDQACSSSFGQTSGAAAVVSGIIAFGLQARKSLTWRAVHHLIRKSSRMDVIDKSVVPILNKAGFQVSNRVGFGLLDALMFANNAEKFNHSLPPQLMCEVDVERQPLRADSTSFTILIDGNKCNNGIIYHLEHVVATFNLEYFKRGVLGAYITSPKGTRSKVIGHRVFDALAGYKRYENLTTLSVHFWGESSLGEWRVVFKNDLPSQGTGPGTLFGFRLTLYGTATPPFDSTSTTVKETSLSTGAVVGVVLAGVFVFCLLVALSPYCIKRIYSRESNPVDIGMEGTHVHV